MTELVEFTCPKCTICGKQDRILLEKDKFDRWQNGEMIQKVWPDMRADKREVLISGTHPKCWDELFAGGE